MTKNYTTTEAAKRLGVSVQAVQLWVDQGHLVAFRTMGGHRRLDPKSVDAMIARRQPGAPVQAALSVVVVENPARNASALEAALAERRPKPILRFLDDPFQALLSIGARPPDLLLVPEQLPGVDVLAMLHAIRRFPKTGSIRLILITGASPTKEFPFGREPDGITVLPAPLTAPRIRAVFDRAMA